MQNARNRSLNYINNGVILPDQKFCRIVPRCFFSSLYLIFYLEILVIICARQKNYDSTSTRNFFDKHNCQITYLPTLFNFTQQLMAQSVFIQINTSLGNIILSIGRYLLQYSYIFLLQLLRDILVKEGIQAINHFLSAIVYLLLLYLSREKKCCLQVKLIFQMMSQVMKITNIFSWGIKSQNMLQLQIVYNQTAID